MGTTPALAGIVRRLRGHGNRGQALEMACLVVYPQGLHGSLPTCRFSDDDRVRLQALEELSIFDIDSNDSGLMIRTPNLEEVWFEGLALWLLNEHTGWENVKKPSAATPPGLSRTAFATSTAQRP
ncbi:Uu.00g032060.m01.CDS01 [Anthostomella pinea]|uniref:Uu.00g032060.m01.CDS01 n=1 Tax=Anthostomella pinea TaxID=933095 RepID=A0AAI8V8M8_9PEZI|nr:Uu.00g032060.m01.CDS01 [Anthostomella pinea]